MHYEHGYTAVICYYIESGWSEGFLSDLVLPKPETLSNGQLIHRNFISRVWYSGNWSFALRLLIVLRELFVKKGHLVDDGAMSRKNFP